MTPEAQHALLALVGVTGLRLSLTDAYLNYVKPSLRPWLILAGILLVAVAGYGLWQSTRSRTADGHGHAPTVAWLLVLPVLAIFLVAPRPLGSFAASRTTQRFSAPKTAFPPLPAQVDGAVPLSLSEYTLRTLYDESRVLDGTTVRLTGFISRDKAGVHLTRFVLSCCAADGRAVKVTLPDRRDLPAADVWIQALGRWAPASGGPAGDAAAGRPVGFDLETFRVIERPTRPYEE